MAQEKRPKQSRIEATHVAGRFVQLDYPNSRPRFGPNGVRSAPARQSHNQSALRSRHLTDSTHRLSRYLLGFAAGFVAVLVFHQGMLTLLHAIHFVSVKPFPLAPTPPFGVPKIWSLAFWGGIWGLVYVLSERSFPRHLFAYLIVAIVFGAIGPSLVAWFVVLPINGLPMGGGFHPVGVITALSINGAWGLGTAIFLLATAGRR